MTTSLPRVAHEHHERLMKHIEEMPTVGRMILSAPIEELRPALLEVEGWLTGLLLPHMEAAERSIYPELERMLQNRHSMTPMRREHAEIRRLVGEFSKLVGGLGDHRPPIGTVVLLRRVLYSLYALLEIHLVEEEEYVRIIDHQIDERAAEMLAAAFSHATILEG
jgi:hypothetical protein